MERARKGTLRIGQERTKYNDETYICQKYSPGLSQLTLTVFTRLLHLS